MPRILELAPPGLAPPELVAVQMLLLYAPPATEVCCHVLPVACCSAIATPAEPEVCGHVLPRIAAVTAVGNLVISQLWWLIGCTAEYGPWACELDEFSLLVCTTRIRNVLVVQVRRMRMYLFCARASSLVCRIALHKRFDGASEVSNVGLAALPNPVPL